MAFTPFGAAFRAPGGLRFRGGGVEGAARPGVRAGGWGAELLGVLRGMEDAHRHGGPAALRPRRAAAGRADEPPGHREHGMARGMAAGP